MTVDALTTLLASKVATRVANDGRSLAISLLQQYRTVDLPTAKVRNGNENRLYPYRPAATSLNEVARLSNRNG